MEELLITKVFAQMWMFSDICSCLYNAPGIYLFQRLVWLAFVTLCVTNVDGSQNHNKAKGIIKEIIKPKQLIPNSMFILVQIMFALTKAMKII